MLKKRNGSNNPIGIFDSGIGGLTVFKAVRERLPFENIVYFGDTARVPYGTKSKETIRKFAEEIARYLKTYKVKFIVVACNTVSSLAMDVVRNVSRVPVIGVIEPGVKEALKTAKKGIIVIGTTATVNSHAYRKEIKKNDKNIAIIEKPCPLFVPMVEEGWADKAIMMEVIREYLLPFNSLDYDSVILGCTHYPLIKRKIQEILPQKRIIDSAKTVADFLYFKLKKNGLLKIQLKGYSKFIVSDDPKKFKKLAYELLKLKIGDISVYNF